MLEVRSLGRGLAETLKWYLASTAWWARVRTRTYDGPRSGLPTTQH
jgi:hypothetical protein